MCVVLECFEPLSLLLLYYGIGARSIVQKARPGLIY